ncbi:MAG: hypothetical protein SGI94_22850, partial [Saprospiraceae bacterium]|nr:hypothetical protein [Saprospiraceae bacterium]
VPNPPLAPGSAWCVLFSGLRPAVLCLALLLSTCFNAMSQPATYYLTEWYASDGLPGSEPEQIATVADNISGNLYVAGVTLNA